MHTQIFLATNYKDEAQLTAMCFKWLNANFPALRGKFFHVPNEMPMIGASAAQRCAIIQKAIGMGVVAGIPDFICIDPLFAIEMKYMKGRLSDQQKTIHEIWSKSMPVYVCKTPQEFLEIIQKEVGNARS
jgi:hypothetical protein